MQSALVTATEEDKNFVLRCNNYSNIFSKINIWVSSNRLIKHVLLGICWLMSLLTIPMGYRY